MSSQKSPNKHEDRAPDVPRGKQMTRNKNKNKGKKPYYIELTEWRRFQDGELEPWIIKRYKRLADAENGLKSYQANFWGKFKPVLKKDT